MRHGAGLAVLTAAVLWERAIYPGLFDLYTPYRATGLFWEMHVGGAAIDAYFVLAMPFITWALWSARSAWRWSLAALLALLSAYACLATFSRGVYAAVAVSPLLLGGLLLLGWRELERGALALGVFLALLLLSLRRLLETAPTWPMAAFIAASLAAVLIAGCANSVFDMPRLACLLQLSMLLALHLPRDMPAPIVT
jgi:hypothetical protein